MAWTKLLRDFALSSATFPLHNLGYFGNFAFPLPSNQCCSQCGLYYISQCLYITTLDEGRGEGGGGKACLRLSVVSDIKFKALVSQQILAKIVGFLRYMQTRSKKCKFKRTW